jgi:hypothetical protein
MRCVITRPASRNLSCTYDCINITIGRLGYRSVHLPLCRLARHNSDAVCDGAICQDARPGDWRFRGQHQGAERRAQHELPFAPLYRAVRVCGELLERARRWCGEFEGGSGMSVRREEVIEVWVQQARLTSSTRCLSLNPPPPSTPPACPASDVSPALSVCKSCAHSGFLCRCRRNFCRSAVGHQSSHNLY